MKTITKIFKELQIPDDQGKNWYAWAANQLSHSLIGAMSAGITLMLSGNMWWAVLGGAGFAILKEIFDILRKPKTWKDSLDDVSFQIAGIQFCVGLYDHFGWLFAWSIFYGALLLWIGVYNRIKFM